MTPSVRRSQFFLLSLFLSVCVAETSTPNTGDQVQSFRFGFTESNLVLPITPSCPTPLTLTQLTTTNAKASDPSAPYTMIALVHEQLIDGSGKPYERLYSASMNVGDMSQTKEIAHPWMNGTQFIGCIWGSNGASGGCQDLYTVVPNERTQEAYEEPNQGCRASNILESWVPASNETLDVDVTGASGEVSWNAWPASCSDLQITPKNGTAPYTLLVAPASHPPVNITSTNSSPMNYTVRLTHGQAFMLGLYDSAGASWAFGPLHAGESHDLSCLSTATGQVANKSGGKQVGVGALAGGIVAAFIVGALGAWAVICYTGLGRRRVKKSPSEDDLYANLRPASYRTASDTLSFKPFSPPSIGNSYRDSPPVDFDTPATLYDPHVAGPHPSNYPKPPNGQARDSTSRPFPRPPVGNEGYVTPYDAEGYDSISLSDLRSPPAAPGAGGGASGNERPGNIQTIHRTSSNEVPRCQGSIGHVQDASWASSASGRTARRSGASAAPGGPHPSSPRPGSFGSIQTAREGREDDGSSPPSSPSSRRPRNVYVVHSDGGGGDVHIQLPDINARVIELPPNYRPGPDHTPSPLPSPALSVNARRDTTANTGAAPAAGPTRARNSVSPAHSGNNNAMAANDVGEEELRARAEAAMREKMRPLS